MDEKIYHNSGKAVKKSDVC